MSLDIDESRIRDGMRDIVCALRDSGTVPDRVMEYDALLERLHLAAENIHGIYRKKMAEPFVEYLEKLGKERFDQKLELEHGTWPEKMFDISEAILQRGDGFEGRATHAFQEVVFGLYDRFLAREKACDVRVGCQQIVPPMTKWGGPTTGPYTWVMADLKEFGVRCSIINLPVAFAKRGLFAWVCLGHEAIGHALVLREDGAGDELKRAVESALQAERFSRGMVEYWSSRLEESASDACGVLQMGPSVAIGLICGFRALNLARGEAAKMSGVGKADNPHPATILRGYLAAATAGLLDVGTAHDWSDLIAEETRKDVTEIRLSVKPLSGARSARRGVASSRPQTDLTRSVDHLVVVDPKTAQRSAEVVASTLVGHKCDAFDGRSLRDIHSWNDQDEQMVAEAKKKSDDMSGSILGSHAVPAAILSALEGEKEIPEAFDFMQLSLHASHVKNPFHTGHP